MRDWLLRAEPAMLDSTLASTTTSMPSPSRSSTLRRRGLRHRADWLSLAYLLMQPALMAWQWWHGFMWLLWLLTLMLAIGISVIHHNHAHLPIWHRRRLNRATDLWITVLQGHPTCVFVPAHNGNHHRYRHGPGDVTATWRFGDHNHFAGWLWHPFQAVVAVYPLILAWLASAARRSPGRFAWYASQYALWLGSWIGLLWMDAGKALLIVIVPQLIGLHWLLAANYLQHAHADGLSRWNCARNFEGWVNRVWFNIGLHTAHHEAPRRHWSTLPVLHAQLRARIDARLIERGLLAYVWRVFVRGLLHRPSRSRSLMPAVPAPHGARSHVASLRRPAHDRMNGGRDSLINATTVPPVSG